MQLAHILLLYFVWNIVYYLSRCSSSRHQLYIILLFSWRLEAHLL